MQTTISNHMKTKSRKILVPAVRSREELESLVDEIACLKLEEARLAAGLDAELRAVQEKQAPRLTGLRQTLEAKMAAARLWAEAHRAEFGRLRSLEMRSGVLGWRSGPPALKLAPAWSWGLVLDKLKTLAEMRDYIRVREEVNKQRLLADRLALGPAALRRVGVAVAQEENFFVEPKLAVTGIAERQRLAA